MLGPVLFTLYTTPLSAIISSFDINHHPHADDTQIYMSLSVSNAKESLEKLQHCLMGVSAWMTGSKLKLNPSKTEFLLIGTKLEREKFLNNFPCLLLGQETNPSTSAKNLGVLFDSNLNFRKHISQTNFKICAITFRTLKEKQPAYLADLLVRLKCSKYLRSTNSNKFVVPRIKTKTGSRAFSISGPALWNALPVPIRNAKTILTFRKLLKSHLFDLAFPP